MDDRVFSEKHRVNFYNADQNGNLLFSSYLNWCGEIAGTHLETRGITREIMLEDDQVFLLTKVGYKCYKPAKYGDIVTLKTWEHSIKGAHFYRCFALERDGELLCESISDWSLVAPKSRKILRPSEYKYEFLLIEQPTSAQINKIKIPELSATGDHIVTFSETDGNGHLNNSNYGNFLVDMAPAAVAEELSCGGVLQSADISFLREARMGEKISIHTDMTDNGYYMYGCFDDGRRCFEAAAELMVMG